MLPMLEVVGPGTVSFPVHSAERLRADLPSQTFQALAKAFSCSWTIPVPL